MLNLMYITNRPEIAQIAEAAGVDWIFVDMEFIGKDVRQKGLDTVQNHHTFEDIVRIKKSVHQAKVIVRVNPIHEARPDYPSSKDEIEVTIAAGADIVMLPYFKRVEEVSKFLQYVNGKAKTCLLVETPESALQIDKILELVGVDMVHIGLNDLHLALGMKFMFELLADGTVDWLSEKIKKKGIPFGFGGIAKLEGGALPGAEVLKEHYRLGSSMVIIGRSFCNTDKIKDIDEIRETFQKGISEIRQLEKEAEKVSHYFSNNRKKVLQSVSEIINQ